MTDMVIPPEGVADVRKAIAQYAWHIADGDCQLAAEAAIDALLPHLRPMLELAGNLGRELGRREALDEAAGLLDGMAAMWATPKDYPEDWDAQHLIVRNASQAATRNAAKAVREIATREPK